MAVKTPILTDEETSGKTTLRELLEAQLAKAEPYYIEKGRQQIINHVEKCFKNAKITGFTGEGGFTQIIMPNDDFEALKEGKDV